MKKILIILGLLMIAVFQITVIPSISIYGVSPNLVLILVLFWVIVGGFNKNWLGILLITVLLDSFSGLPFGLVSLSLITTAYLIDLLNISIFSVVKLWISSVLVLSGILIYNFILVILSRIIYNGLSFDIRYLVIELIYSQAILIIVYYGYKKIFYREKNR